MKTSFRSAIDHVFAINSLGITLFGLQEANKGSKRSRKEKEHIEETHCRLPHGGTDIVVDHVRHL